MFAARVVVVWRGAGGEARRIRLRRTTCNVRLLEVSSDVI
jgi:hypothetical protein